jgi:hypothetical protein
MTDSLKTKLNHLENNLGELYLYASRRYLGNMFGQRKRKILFSRKDDWEPLIRRSFRYSRHELTFGAFAPDAIEKNDLIVPLNVEDIRYLNEVRHLIVDNPIPIPTNESIRRCDDKSLFNRVLMENGFGNFIPRISADLRYPYILKKNIDAWGKNSHIVLNEEQESEISEKLSSREYYRQYLVPGKYEYATHVLFSMGRIVHSINIEYCFESDVYVKGKNPPVHIKKVDHSPYLGIFSSILSLIGFEGLCCVNYKDIDGCPLLFEINPRFGGSLCSHFYSFMKFL